MLKIQRSMQMVCMAAMALTVFSCTNEELVQQPVLKGNTTIVATLGGNESSTRTSVNDAYQILWSETDKFGIFYENRNIQQSEFTIDKATAGARTATFHGNTQTEQTPDFAIYPYDANMSVTDKTLKMKLPAAWNYTTDSNGPMYAKVTDPNNPDKLSFKHMAALMKLTINKIPDNATTFTITASNNIAGNCTADLNQEMPVLAVTDDDAANKTITVTLLTTPKESSRSFFIPLPAGTYEQITAELTNGSDKLFFTKTIKNQTLERSNILVLPALDCVTIEATTPEAINSALADNIKAPEAGEVKTTDIALTGEIDATSDNSAITIPVLNSSNVNLAFTTAPKTTTQKPLILEEKDLSGDVAPTEAVNRISIAVPEVTSGSTEVPEAPSLTITMPKTTVELGSVGTKASYKKVIAKTATNTLIVKAGVTIEELEITGGNVEIYGTVKKLTLSNDNATTVVSGGEADIQEVIDTYNKFVFSSIWDGISRANLPASRKIYTAAQLASLQGTANADAVTGTNYPAATTTGDITLCSDINLNNHPWVGIVLGEGHTFNGQKSETENYTVRNITIKEGSYDNLYSGRKDHSSAGFIGAALLNSSVKNLTVDSVSIGSKETSIKWAGALVGYSNGAKSYENCIAKNVTFDCNGNRLSFRVGGLIGYIQENTSQTNAVTITKCSVTNAHLTADFSYGGLLGSLWDSVTMTDCETSGITLGNSGCNFNHGYCSYFIGDAVNAKSEEQRELIINNCTVRDGQVNNGAELGFDLVPYEQRHVGKYEAARQNKYFGYVDNDTNFSIMIDNTSQVEGTHYNIYEGTVSYWDGKSTYQPVYNEGNKVYAIKTAAELAWLAQEVSKGTDFSGTTFQLKNDLDLDNKAWTPIGDHSLKDSINPKEKYYRPNVKFFKGTFDGGGKTISNLTVNHPTPGSGLFGNVQNAIIKNFTIENASINGSGKWTAVVIGYAYEGLKVEGVHVKNSKITMTNPAGAVKLGGIVSFASGAFKGDIILNGCSVSDFAIDGGCWNHGGLAGYIFQAKSFKVENCTVENISIKVSEKQKDNKANYNSPFLGCFNNTATPQEATSATFNGNSVKGYYTFDGTADNLGTFTISNAGSTSDTNYANFACAPWFGDSDANMPITINSTVYTKSGSKYTAN